MHSNALSTHRVQWCVWTSSFVWDWWAFYKNRRCNRYSCNSYLILGDISRDVSRTFPTHSLFQSTAELGQQMLENVLRCVSEYFPNIGYCQVELVLFLNQGMNFVVAVILIALIDPEGKGFSADSEEKKKMFQYIIMYILVLLFTPGNLKPSSKNRPLQSSSTLSRRFTWRVFGVQAFLS